MDLLADGSNSVRSFKGFSLFFFFFSSSFVTLNVEKFCLNAYYLFIYFNPHPWASSASFLLDTNNKKLSGDIKSWFGFIMHFACLAQCSVKQEDIHPNTATKNWLIH